MTNKIKVLVVDDSAVVRQVLTEHLNQNENIEVVATAADPFIARNKMIDCKPDVMTLDMEMPRMDGLNFLKKVMTYQPMPVIVLSSLTSEGSQLALEALSQGASFVLNKPGSSYSVGEMIPQLIECIIQANGTEFKRQKTKLALNKSVQKVQPLVYKTTHKIIALGASTGGTQALEKVLCGMPENSPGIVVVQHMPEHFTKTFAQRLNDILPHVVKEAADGDAIIPGQILLAPGNYHLEIVKNGAVYEAKLNQEEREHYQRPAVDVLFRSLAKVAGQNVIAAILTGMGKDGATGLKALRDSGAYTIGQDEASSVVYGMPKAAKDIGAVIKEVPLENIANEIINKIKEEGF